MENFTIHKNILVANIDLYWEHHTEFKEKSLSLLQGKHKSIVLDLTAVTFVFSTYMGTIGKLLALATNADKKLTIRISENLGWLFELTGFNKMINIEIAS